MTIHAYNASREKEQGMGLVETEAIILRNFKLGEADKLVVALTRSEGIVRGVARGARRLKSKYGASLEPFTSIQLSFFEKESSELVSFTHTEIVESHFELTRSDTVFLALEYLAGLILEFAPLRAPDERLYRMLRACLESMAADPQQVSFLVRYCEIWTLKIGGFLPDVDRCGECRKAFGQDGGVLDADNAIRCRRCSQRSGIFISYSNLQGLNAALKSRPTDWAQMLSTRSENSLSELGIFASVLLGRALEREPRLRSPFSSS